MDKQGGDVAKFFAVANSLQASFVGCTEHNLNFTQSESRMGPIKPFERPSSIPKLYGQTPRPNSPVHISPAG
jgi:hypothetical protein